MKDYIKNLEKFNILCKECNNSDVIISNENKQIVFTCRNCKEKEKSLESIKRDNNQLMEKIIKNYRLLDLKKSLKVISEDSINVINIISNIDKENALREKYAINTLKYNQLCDKNVNYLIKSMNGLKVINNISVKDDYISIRLDIFLIEEAQEYKISFDRYDLNLKVYFSKYKGNIQESTNIIYSEFNTYEKGLYVDNIKNQLLKLEKLINTI